MKSIYLLILGLSALCQLILGLSDLEFVSSQPTTGIITCESFDVGNEFLTKVYKKDTERWSTSTSTILVVNNSMLKEMVNKGSDVTKICTTHVTDMSGLFKNK